MRKENVKNQKKRVALLVNMISPAKVPLFSMLADAFDLLILHGGVERNRDSWREFESALPNARVVLAWGWQIPFARRKNGQHFDEQYMHVNPGYLWHLLRFNPAVVISNEMGVRTLFALLYGAIFRRPVWVWWGGTVHTEGKKAGRIKRLVRRCFAKWAKHWISYGQSSTQYLLSLGIPQQRILELQNTTDERPFLISTPARFNLQPRPVVLYVGQFIARKGVDHLLRAAAALQRIGLTFSLLLVGGGRDRDRAEELARQLGLSNIHFRPSCSPAEMPSVYRSADVLIFPTLEDPWGLVASEAILAGIPVLCSKYAGCAIELFSSESIFDPENHAEFVSKLRQAVTGGLPAPDATRVRTTPGIAAELINAIQKSDEHETGAVAESRQVTVSR